MNVTASLAIFFTILLTMILELIPFPEGLPEEIGFLRPELVLMTLIYWVIALPHRAGVVLAWISGLIMDILVGNFLGQFGCSFVIISFVVLQFYQRLRMFSVWQQAILVSGLIILHRGLSFLFVYFFDGSIPSLWQVMPAISSALVWPLVFLLLRAFRRSLKLR
tara:strand:+ start:104 stop:595 length:492 start_codon:yes stop_codon:yes gene_type:complete